MNCKSGKCVITPLLELATAFARPLENYDSSNRSMDGNQGFEAANQSGGVAGFDNLLGS